MKNSTNEKIKLSDLSQKSNVIGFYFDADWCLPSKEFLKELRSVYLKSKEVGLKFEIIFVSFDHDRKSCFENFRINHGDWYLWPYQKKSIKYKIF